MNNPAPKEPSMDEILSSIRQIIADDDAGARRPTPMPMAPPAVQRVSSPLPSAIAPLPAATAPLSLSAEQIVLDEEMEPEALEFEAALASDDEDDLEAPANAGSEPLGFDEADLVDGDDIAFESEPEPEPVRAPEPAAMVAPRPAPRPAAAVSRAAPMPDQTLSADIAEQLLKPATDAAVRHTFARLGTLAVGAPGMTVEDMMRDMLRPMLKDWLDENLPSVVERMVEKEIARISRGVE